MKLIIAGSRTYTNYGAVEYAMRDLRPARILSGGADGVDALGEQWARRHGVPLTIYPANWERHGKAAGPIRNAEMARNADALLLLWDGQSSGSRNMLETAWRHGLIGFVGRYGYTKEARSLAGQLQRLRRQGKLRTRQGQKWEANKHA